MQRLLTGQITGVFALLLAGAVAAGCGGGAKSPIAVETKGNIFGAVDGNHAMPHVAMITAAQIAARAAITIDISNGLHSHGVALTSTQMSTIAGGGRVSVTSSTDTHSNGSDPHSHGVTFN